MDKTSLQSAFRELTAEELEMVSGGSDVGEPADIDWPVEDPEPIHWEPGGGDGDPPPPPPPPPGG